MTGPSRRIEAGAVGLPRSFVVIESDSYDEAVRDMSDAFADPETHLVVWNKGANLVGEGMKEAIQKLTQIKTNFQYERELHIKENFFDRVLKRRIDSPGLCLRRTFNIVADITECDRNLFGEWEMDSQALMHALQQRMNPSGLVKMIRGRLIDEFANLHFDTLPTSGNIVTIRVLSGDTTEYYDPADYLGPKMRGGFLRKEKYHAVTEDATRWMAGSLAVVFHSGKILHAIPSVEHDPLAAGQYRLTEFFLGSGGRDMMACQRPVPKARPFWR